MSDQIGKILKMVSKNPEIVDIAAKIPDIAQNFLNKNPSGIIGTAPMDNTVMSTMQQVTNVSNVRGTLEGIHTFYSIRNIIIIFLVLWAIAIVLARFLVNDDKIKKDIEFFNTTLFGSIGIIPIIVSLWTISVLFVTLVPSLISVLPKMGNVADSLSSFLTGAAGAAGVQTLKKLVS